MGIASTERSIHHSGNAWLYRAAIFLVFLLDNNERTVKYVQVGLKAMRRSLRNLTPGVALTIAAVLTGQSVFAEKIPAATDPSTQGEWGAPFDIGITAVHSVLLQNGKTLSWQFSEGPTGGSRAVLWDPASGAVTDVSVP